MKSFKEFQESVAQEVGGKGLTGAVIKGVANLASSPIRNAAKVANIFLSKKKKAKEKEDLLGAVRKKQAEIQQDVADKETLNQNKDFEKKEKDRGKYLPRKRKPENQFYGEGM